MTRDDQLRALVAKWRSDSQRLCALSCFTTADHVSQCADELVALLASPPAPHDVLLDAARAVDAVVRRTHNHTEWLEPLSRLMHAVEGTAASPPAPALKTVQGICGGCGGAEFTLVEQCDNCDCSEIVDRYVGGEGLSHE